MLSAARKHQELGHKSWQMLQLPSVAQLLEESFVRQLAANRMAWMDSMPLPG